MRRLHVKDLLLIVIALSTLYWTAAVFVPSFILNDLLDGALIALCFTVTYQYLSWSLAHLGAVADRQMTIRAGIVLSWMATGIWRLERFMLQERAFGYEGPVGLHDPLRGFMICLLIIGATYHIMAFNMDVPGRPRNKNIYIWLGSALLGSGVVILLHLSKL
jgi:hypothetical protein